MATVTISAASIPWDVHPPSGVTQVEARVFVDKAFVPAGGDAPIQPGLADSSLWYQTFSCTIAGGVLSLPEITLESTTDGTPQTARYFIRFYSLGNVPFSGFHGFRLQPDSPTTWSQIFADNNDAIPLSSTIDLTGKTYSGGTFTGGTINSAATLSVTGSASGSANLIEAFESGDSTARTKVSPDGKVQTRAGNGATPATDFITLGGLYHHNFTTVGNQTGGEDTLMTKTVAANVLGEDGDTIVVVATGTMANVAGNLTIRAKYAGSTIDTRIANGIGAVANWRWVLEISRNGGNAFCSSMVLIQNAGSDTTFHRMFNTTANPAVTHSNANALTFTGESANAADNDITQTSMRVWKYSAP